jgi:hypothetical protein
MKINTRYPIHYYVAAIIIIVSIALAIDYYL